MMSLCQAVSDTSTETTLTSCLKKLLEELQLIILCEKNVFALLRFFKCTTYEEAKSILV